MRRASVFLTLVLVMSLALSGCLKNPMGKIGPSWDVPVQVPLMAGATTVYELLEKALQDYLPDEYNPEKPLAIQFSESWELDPGELAADWLPELENESVQFDVNTAALLDETTISVEVPDIEISIRDRSESTSVPVVDLEANEQHLLDIIDLPFASAVLVDGALQITVTNNSAVPLDVTVTLGGINGIFGPSLAFAVGPAGHETDSLDLAGASLASELSVSVSVDGNIAGATSHDELVFEFAFVGLKAEHVVGLETEDPEDFDFEVELNGLPFDAITFSSGELAINHELLAEGQVVITEVEASQDGHTVDLLEEGLADVTLTNVMTLFVKAKLTPVGGRISTLPVDQRAISVAFENAAVKKLVNDDGFDDVTVRANNVTWWDNTDIASVGLGAGRLHFTLAGVADNVTVAAVKIGGRELTPVDSQESSFDLAGVTLASDSPVELTLKSENTELKFDDDPLTVTVNITGVEVLSVTAVINESVSVPGDLEIEPVALNLDFDDWSQLFTWPSEIGVEVAITVQNDSGLPVDLSGLDLIVTGRGDEEFVLGLESKSGDVYTVSSGRWPAILASQPQLLSISGELAVGGKDWVTVDLTRSIAVTVDLIFRAKFTIDYDGEFEDLVLGSREVTEQADLEKGFKYVGEPALFA